ncbi:unnamed protein product, partial [Ostreobium quekettii]
LTLIKNPSPTSKGCVGMLIKDQFILTAAHCVEGPGANPMVIVGATSVEGPHAEHGGQEVRTEMTFVHPQWTGNVEDGHDLALLKLNRKLNASSPTLVDRKHEGIPSSTRLGSQVFGFMLGSNLETAAFNV